MPFWSSQTIEAKLEETAQRGEPLVFPFDKRNVGQGAYELSLSREVAISPNPESLGQQLVRGILHPSKLDQDPMPVGIGPALTIPAGQFALLYTEEWVIVPKNVFSLISIKAKVKLKGLVNISGFHVDPGFSGRIKFSVYNAGNNPICLIYGQPYFLLWFADLDHQDSKPYDRSHNHNGQSGVTAEDREQMSEPSQSPAALHKRLEHLEEKFNWIAIAGGVILTALLLPLLISVFGVFFQKWCETPNTTSAPKSPNLVHTNRIVPPNQVTNP